MVYNREEFIPTIHKRDVRIKYNAEIIGFILIQPEMDEGIDFFSSISRLRFNVSLRKLNNILQRRFCERKKSLSKIHFTGEITFIKYISVFFFFCYLLMFFLVDHTAIDKSDSLDNVRYPTLAIQVFISLFFFYFIFIMMMNKPVYNLDEKINISIEDFIKTEENFYRSDGYRWNFSEKKKLLIIERDF